MVLIVDGIDKTNVSWIYSGSEPKDHHCTVDFSFQADPNVEPLLPSGHFAGILSFVYCPPFEHITFIALDQRTLSSNQKLALAVLKGNDAAAFALADKVIEN